AEGETLKMAGDDVLHARQTDGGAGGDGQAQHVAARGKGAIAEIEDDRAAIRSEIHGHLVAEMLAELLEIAACLLADDDRGGGEEQGLGVGRHGALPFQSFREGSRRTSSESWSAARPRMSSASCCASAGASIISAKAARTRRRMAWNSPRMACRWSRCPRPTGASSAQLNHSRAFAIFWPKRSICSRTPSTTSRFSSRCWRPALV